MAAERFCRVALGALVAALAAGASSRAAAEAQLEVSGTVVSPSPLLRVRVAIRNRGDRAAAPLDVTGELLGQRREARVASLAPGASAPIVLEYDAARARPGLHALVLLLEHPVEGAADAAGNPPLASRRAFVPVAFGRSAEPAVRLTLSAEPLDVSGWLDAGLESMDGAPHRIRVRAFTARGLRSDGEGALVAVAGAGKTVARLPLVRAGAPRGTRHDVLVVAEAEDGPLARATVASASILVTPDPSILPHVRAAMLVLGLALLGLALGVEAWRRSRRHVPAAGPEA